MARRTALALPATNRLLQHLGERLALARRRRRLTALQVAARAGMSTMTLRSIERGGAGVTIGAYVAVMHVLGLERDIDLMAKDDALGRELQDAALPHRRGGRRARRADTPPPRTSPRPPAPPPVSTPQAGTDAPTSMTSDELAALITPTRPV